MTLSKLRTWWETRRLSYRIMKQPMVSTAMAAAKMQPNDLLEAARVLKDMKGDSMTMVLANTKEVAKASNHIQQEEPLLARRGFYVKQCPHIPPHLCMVKYVSGKQELWNMKTGFKAEIPADFPDISKIKFFIFLVYISFKAH